MKRRNVDCAKIRRPVKRNKITEGIFGSSLLYLKFLLLWVFVMGADYMLEFRFEFLWPFWLLLRSVYDSFKYQGLAFSVFFVCIALTSDMICFFFIPVNWLFFAASTYVWVQYVWHTDKGICLPTIVLWILFVYLEAAVRLREMRNLPFHLDLCRPFAAHCIGYPVVTLGFGFKSYVGYRMRQRKQRDVAKENEFYTQLLQQALPVDEVSTQLASTVADPTVSLVATEKIQTPTTAQMHTHTHTSRHEKSREKNKSDAVTNSVPNGPSNATVLHNGTLHNGAVHNGVVHNGVLCNAPSKNSHRKSVDKANNDHKHQHLHENHISSEKNSDTKKYSLTNGSVIGNHTDSEYIEKSHHETDDTPSELPEKLERTSTKINSVRNKSNKENVKENNRENNTQHRKKERHRETIDKSQKESSDKASDKSTEKVDKSFENKSEKTESDCVQQRLEWELKKVRTELVSCRHSEQELRAQVTTLSTAERSNRHELSQLRKENEELQNKVQSLTSARQADRQTVERRLGEERRVRASLEAQLAHERRVQQQAQLSKAECTEQCRARRRELEMEARELRAGTRVAEERVAGVEREKIQQQRDADVLLASLAAAQDKNQHLENSLSAETRIKLDLFSALGETKRQLEIRDSMIRSQEKEIDDLKSKIAQVLAVMPLSGDTFGGGGVVPSSRVRLAESPAAAVGSTLDPNATAYTPKGSLVAGATEA